jgi:hypothetical protein
VWLERLKGLSEGEVPRPSRVVSWPARVARENPIEEHLGCYRLLFPGKQVTPCIFAGLISEQSAEAQNGYIRDSVRRFGLPALLFALPRWSAEEPERRVLESGFGGIKVYLNLARILEIECRWPRAQVVLAHVGRAFCEEDVGEAFEVLWRTEQLLRAVGPRRVLFGSDLPILRMRARRICENGVYVNLVPKSLYGDVSGDKNMREIEGLEAERLSFFMYEELLAFPRAAERCDLGRGDVEDVFYNNTARVLTRAGFRELAPASGV